VRLGAIPGSPRPISFVSLGWEVVQSVVHQPLELTILVRVQASQPTLKKANKNDGTSNAGPSAYCSGLLKSLHLLSGPYQKESYEHHSFNPYLLPGKGPS
jgi:hypothetical protein